MKFHHLKSIFLLAFAGICGFNLLPCHAKSNETIVVNKANNTLQLYIKGQLTHTYPVATGLYKCTPEGSFKIIQKTFISKSGRGEFGTRWMCLNTLGQRGLYHIGIHGTNEPNSIGKYASKACVRMHNADVNQVFDLVHIGTTVRIINVPIPKRDEVKVLLSFLQSLHESTSTHSDITSFSPSNIMQENKNFYQLITFHPKVRLRLNDGHKTTPSRRLAAR